jgi:hypothetical protein
MPRYYFNVRDSVELPDEIGTELPGLDAVRDMAVKAAGEAIRELGGRFWDAEEWQMVVTDENGREVLILTFSGSMRSTV